VRSPITTVKNQLTTEEATRLAELEPIIANGITNFVEVGNALIEVSDRRLYRETHSTFQEYCQDKWNITARRAYQLCEAAEVIKLLPESVNHGSQINERQARELAKVKPEKRVEVIESVTSKGPVTAKAIRVVIAGDAGQEKSSVVARGGSKPMPGVKMRKLFRGDPCSARLREIRDLVTSLDEDTSWPQSEAQYLERMFVGKLAVSIKEGLDSINKKLIKFFEEVV
jgi:hypothetical protein